MSYAIHLSEDGRVLFAAMQDQAHKGAILVEELPAGNITDYIYRDGEFVSSPLPEPEVPEQEPDVYDELAAAYSEGVQSA